MKITASLVTYHTQERDLNRLLACVNASSIEHLYVIDNSENDNLRSYFAGRSNIDYIFNNANLGYGRAHNIGIRESLKQGAEYHVVLNPDIYWRDNVICDITRFMDQHPDCGLAMPKILYPNGTTQYLCKQLPSPTDLFVRRFIPFKSYKAKRDYDYELQWSGYNKVMEVPVLSGCFMFMRTSVLRKVQGFDERFFMYAEDVDLCRRIGEVSKLLFYPNVSVYHEYEKGSYKNMKLLKHHTASLIKYFNKWGWVMDKERERRNMHCRSLIQRGL